MSHRYLFIPGSVKVDIWTARFKLARVDFSPVQSPAGPRDPFFNANRPEDLVEAERFARALGGKPRTA